MTTVESEKPRLHTRVVALVGNPNTGKTTLFNALAGMRQHVGNYPGVTVETKKGRLISNGQTFDIVDLPGTYSLAPRSPDEMVAVDLILGQQPGEARPDVVVSIVDASNLERNLYLTTQVMELRVPVVVALNMMDVAQKQGLHIDVSRLESQLGLRVVPIQANKGRGLDELKQAISDAAAFPPPSHSPSFPEPFERETSAFGARLGNQWPPFLIRRLLLDVGGYTEKRLAEIHSNGLKEELHSARLRLESAGCKVPDIEARTRYGWIRRVTAGCVRRPERRPVAWTDRLDQVLTHKMWGTFIFLALMFVVFQAIFTGAAPLMDLLKNGKDWLGGGLRGWLPAGPLGSMVVDGVLEGVGSILVFLPQIIILFGFIAVLEDCGYMARAAFLMDKVMAGCGLSGKSFIPMLSSVACAVPGIMATRVIENRRDRLATILVAPLMSCSARLPVYTLMIGAFLTVGFPAWVPGFTLFGMYLIGLVVAPLMALVLKRTLLRGETPLFVMEMPLYKRPSVRTVLRRVTDSGWAFVRRAGTFILASMIVIWALLYFPRTSQNGQPYDLQIATLRNDLSDLKEKASTANGEVKKEIEETMEEMEKSIAQVDGEWKRNSYLGRMGRSLEPVVKPLGWDWKIGMAALASFPAREVVVGTLGIIYNTSKVDSGSIREAENVGETPLAKALKEDKVFTVPVALSLMVFFALCCQCASTLAVIGRETNSWRWPLFTFGYMTMLGYLGALVVYQVGSRLC
ncbi:MAG TPA: ferrous iron transport protein B [Gemmataceae bacterium]|jgi:ferrous iron transport protein B|nr:ferrous iron transport protein B [Gemmataceae bacterium]